MFSLFEDEGMYEYHIICLSKTTDTLVYCKSYAD